MLHETRQGMEISIIILSYKMKGLVRNCLRALQDAQLDLLHEIIIVDNGSQDNIEELQQQFPDIKIVIAPENLGMGAGNNLGIKKARGKYLLMLNPDIYIFPGAIEKMYNYIKDKPDIGLVSPRLLNPDKTLQYTCYRWHQPLTPLYRRTFLGRLKWAQKKIDHFLMTDFDHQTIQAVDWCQGSCFLIPKEVIDQVGQFDEQFFMYFEDTDLCRRIWQKGYQIIYLGDTELIHLHTRASQGGLTQIISNKLTREHIKSWIRYSLKHRKTKIKIK